MSEFWKSLRRSFFAGLLVVVPVAASIGILLWLFNTVTSWLLPEALLQHRQSFLFRLVALIATALLVTFVGWITRLVVGKRLIVAGEALINRVPLLNKTYGFMKEISHTMLSGRKTMFQGVVLVEYPRPGVYTIGFVTGQTKGEAQAKTPTELVNVFFPTTPNPTSGWLALVPRQQVIELDMSVTEGMKLVISGGSVVPPPADR
jgi:uncharacterized membrane protein